MWVLTAHFSSTSAHPCDNTAGLQRLTDSFESHYSKALLSVAKKLIPYPHQELLVKQSDYLTHRWQPQDRTPSSVPARCQGGSRSEVAGGNLWKRRTSGQRNSGQSSCPELSRRPDPA